MRGKDQIEKSGKPWELTSYWNSVGLEVPVSNIVNAHFHLSRAGGSSIHVFWQTCKVATACSQTHHPSSFKLRTKAASRINRALLYATGLPAWSPSSLVSQLPGHHRHSSAWLQLPCQHHPAHTAYTEVTSTQDYLFQNWERKWFN